MPARNAIQAILERNALGSVDWVSAIGAILESVQSPFWFSDEHSRVVVFNRALATKLSLDIKDIDAGIPVEDVLLSLYGLQSDSCLLNGPKHSPSEVALQAMIAPQSLEIVLSGGKFIQVHSTPLMYEGKLQGVWWSVTDVSHTRALEAHLREQQTRVNEMAHLTSVATLAAGISHEINNPLSVIVTLTAKIQRDCARGDLSPELLQTDLEKLKNVSLRMAKIVGGLRSLVRNEGLGGRENKSISEIIDDVREFVTGKARRSGVELYFSRLPSVELHCQPVQISQTLINLIHNSIDAVKSQPTPWVRIEASIEGELVVIRVLDSGKGIPVEFQQAIFDPFFSGKERDKGTGLGLPISKRLAEEHGGTLRLDTNSPNTCFELRLPLPLGYKHKKSAA